MYEMHDITMPTFFICVLISWLRPEEKSFWIQAAIIILGGKTAVIVAVSKLIKNSDRCSASVLVT